ncbi:MAG TPA: hypothetical protein VEH50_08230 [Methylomirabilota bacterium]|nr:hypothetical protein [Methylomirabilota bacterium]
MLRPFVLVLSALFLAPVALPAAQPHELLGFLLEQDPAAFDHALGQPFKTGSLPGQLAMRAYMIPGAKETYLVAVFNIHARAVRLELTGQDYTGPTGFLGLTLGEDASAVKSVLGEPAETRHEDDFNVDFWDYKPSNYSLEFTLDHKLYSIQVNEDPPREPRSFAHSPEVRKYALAIEAGDIDTVVRMSSGFLICTDKSELGFTRAARTDLADSSGDLAGCLKKAAAAIVALGEGMTGADDQFRFAERGGPFCVTKFPASSPLKEVVFTWEVDDWRVFEVTLR